jgi:hypothetical protein
MVLSFVGEVVPVEGAARAVGEEAQGSLSCPRRAYRLDSLTGSEETRVRRAWVQFWLLGCEGNGGEARRDLKFG